MRLGWAPFGAWLPIVLGTSTLLAHDLGEQRHVLVSVEPGVIEVLVAYELPAGQLARELRAAIDQDGNGAVDREAERLARAQVLIARVRAGWSVCLGNSELALELADLSFRDNVGTDHRRGFEGMVIYRAAVPDLGSIDSVRIELAPGAASVRAEIQVTPPLTVVDSPLPPAGDAPVVGPVEVTPDLPLEVRISLSGEQDARVPRGAHGGTGSESD